MRRHIVSHCYVFFIKQKTAYEMRISDWSSDVCSSDLQGCVQDRQGQVCRAGRDRGGDGTQHRHRTDVRGRCRAQSADPAGDAGTERAAAAACRPRSCVARSEEHTSELQSLMRSSYAVFCLTKTKRTEHLPPTRKTSDT